MEEECWKKEAEERARIEKEEERVKKEEEGEKAILAEEERQ